MSKSLIGTGYLPQEMVGGGGGGVLGIGGVPGRQGLGGQHGACFGCFLRFPLVSQRLQAKQRELLF